MNTNAKLVAVAAVIIIVASAGFYAISNGHGDDSDAASKMGCLWIYGNVNGDDRLDLGDVDLLEKIVSGKEEQRYFSIYDGYSATGASSTVSFADANGDGKVDSADIAHLKALISYQEKYSKAVEDGTLDSFKDEITVFYNNCDNKMSSVHLPVRSLISMYFSNSEVVRLLGATDRVIGTDDTTLAKPTLLPEFKGIPRVTDRKSPVSEDILAAFQERGASSGWAYFTGSASTYGSYLEDQVGGYVDVIRLSAWEDNNIMEGTLTIGWMLGCTAKAYEYIDWCNHYIDMVSDRLKGVADGDKATVIVPKGRLSSLNDSNGPGSGQFEISELAGAHNIASKLTAVSSEYPSFDDEFLFAENPTFLIYSGYAGFEKTPAALKDMYDVVEKRYAQLGAVKDGKLGFIANEIFTGPSDIVSMMCLATWFYPDLFKDIDGLTVFHDYIDRFCPGLADYDLDSNIGNFVIAPGSA